MYELVGRSVHVVVDDGHVELRPGRELERRLVGRGTETAEEQERRLDTARLEMAAEPEFTMTIVNDDVHRATDELVQCMGLVPRPLGVARG